jgi:hypothetical protein
VFTTLNTYSHVVGTTAHEQIAKINDLFNRSNTATSEIKPSIKNRIAESKERLLNEVAEKPLPEKAKKRDEQDI